MYYGEATGEQHVPRAMPMGWSREEPRTASARGRSDSSSDPTVSFRTHVGHFDLIICSIALFLLNVCLILVSFINGCVSERYQNFEIAWDLCGGVDSQSHPSRVHLRTACHGTKNRRLCLDWHPYMLCAILFGDMQTDVSPEYVRFDIFFVLDTGRLCSCFQEFFRQHCEACLVCISVAMSSASDRIGAKFRG